MVREPLAYALPLRCEPILLTYEETSVLSRVARKNAVQGPRKYSDLLRSAETARARAETALSEGTQRERESSDGRVSLHLE